MMETITSKHNPLLVHVKKLLSSRSYREKCGEFAADGTKLLEEAAKWDAGLQTVIVQEGVQICALPETVRVVQVSTSLMRDLSQMEAPQGAIFVCKLPQSGKAEIRKGSLLLDGIQDPGNLGTILRTADALDVPVLLCEGCADAYNPKTVRASMGAVLRTPPQSVRRQDVIAACKEKNIPLFATAMSEDAVDLRQEKAETGVVIIGSEGQGVCEELLAAADRKLIIPMSSRCESLNAAVAASVLMWEMRKQSL